MKRKLTTLVALMLSCLLAMLASSLKETPSSKKNPLRITRVWTVETDPAVSAWLKKRAAAFEKETGSRIYLRTATQEEMNAALIGEEHAIAPDLMISCTQGEPLAYLGYALILRDEKASVITPAPTSALFYRPTATPGPSPTPAPSPDISALGGVLVPSHLPIQIPGAIKSQNAASDFAAQKAPAALLTAGQASALSFGYQAYALSAGEGVLTIAGEWLTSHGEAFADYLKAEPSQLALKNHGLYSVLPTLSLYGDEDPLRALIERSLP